MFATPMLTIWSIGMLVSTATFSWLLWKFYGVDDSNE